MEWITQFADVLRDNWAKVLLWITAPVVGGVSLWQLFSFLVGLIKNHTAKKYTKPLKNEFSELKKSIEQFKIDVSNILAEKVEEYSKQLMAQFNELADKTQARKQEIYEEIIGIPNTPEVIEKKIEMVTKPNDAEIDSVAEKDEKVEEVIKVEDKNEPQDDVGSKPSEIVDLL